MAHRVTFNGPLAWSLAFIAGTLALMIVLLPPLISAATGSTATADVIGEEFARYMDRHDDEMETYQSRFNGRSVFFKPPPIRVAPPPEPPKPPRETRTPIAKVPTTPPPPRPEVKPKYTGPSVESMLGDEVWFDNGMRVRVGESSNGIEVVSTNPPWSATIKKGKWEYELPLFPSPDIFSTDDGRSVNKPVGLIETEEDEKQARLARPASRTPTRTAPPTPRRSRDRGRRGDDEDNEREIPDE